LLEKTSREILPTPLHPSPESGGREVSNKETEAIWGRRNARQKERGLMVYGQNLAEINSDLTPEVMSKVDGIIAHHKDKPGSLIPVLEETQGVVGYLPVELQEYISRCLNVPASTVYGVVTFYSFFTMVPKGRHTIKVCMGTACYVKGIGEVLNRLQGAFKLEPGKMSVDKRFSLEVVRCLGACGLAPVVVVDTDTHGGMTPDRIVDVLNRYE
jgi:NADH:ubiquinone oxidoreductase subunit E